MISNKSIKTHSVEFVQISFNIAKIVPIQWSQFVLEGVGIAYTFKNYYLGIDLHAQSTILFHKSLVGGVTVTFTGSGQYEFLV